MDLIKITADWPRRLFGKLQRAAALEDISESDALTRAVILYEYYCKKKAQGCKVLFERPDGTVHYMDWDD